VNNMTLALVVANTGFGIGSNIGVYRWNAHSFNPSADTDYQTWDPWTEAWTGFYISNPTLAFDLTGFWYGNEAMLAAIHFETDVDDDGDLTMDWYDPDANLLFSFSVAWSIVAGNWYAAWSGIGVKAAGAEIWKNGTYHVDWSVVGNFNTISGDIYPVVSNYPGATAGAAGYIWVDDDYLMYTCYQGYVIRCNHDGTSSDEGGHEGYIWLEDDGKIAYIDDDGFKRMTKMGDEFGWPPDPDELPTAGEGANDGYIWVSTGDYTDTFLCIISDDGNKYRIGPGYVHAGDYQ